jgi:hypothetical protein
MLYVVDRDGPLRCSDPHLRVGSQAGVTTGMEHKGVSMGMAASMKLHHARLLSFSPGCGQSTAASRASSSMQTIGVHALAWPVATAPDGSGCDNSPTSMHGQIGTRRHRHGERSMRGGCTGKPDTGQAAGAGVRTCCWRRTSRC